MEITKNIDLKANIYHLALKTRIQYKSLLSIYSRFIYYECTRYSTSGTI